MDNVEEMHKFLEKYNFPKLDQEEIENLNRPITSTEIETVIRVAFSFSRGSSQPRDRTQVSCIAGGFFPSWAAVFKLVT